MRALIWALLTFAISGQAYAESTTESKYMASIYEVIVLPEKYLGKIISVKGYLSGTPPHLFSSKEGSRINDVSSGIALEELALGEFNECMIGYVSVVGRLEKSREFYQLTDIEQVYSLDRMKHCEVIPFEWQN